MTPSFMKMITILKWLEKWEEDSQDNSSNNNTFVSTTLFDMKSMIIGFRQLCRIAFEKFEGIAINANKINTDVVENTFSQARARNGQNDNPTVAEYGKLSMNIYCILNGFIAFLS